MSDARLFRVIVPVADMRRAIAFYSTLLDHPGTPTGAPNRHYFDCGGVILACVQPPPSTAGGNGFRANQDYTYFAVDDLEGAQRRAQLAGAQAPDPQDHAASAAIETRPWGERSFYLRDPFGNPLYFVEARTAFGGLTP